jgi:hypothetical protein
MQFDKMHPINQKIYILEPAVLKGDLCCLDTPALRFQFPWRVRRRLFIPGTKMGTLLIKRPRSALVSSFNKPVCTIAAVKLAPATPIFFVLVSKLCHESAAGHSLLHHQLTLSLRPRLRLTLPSRSSTKGHYHHYHP